MLSYIIRRLALVIPTLFGIMVLNFVFVQFAPGGPVEQTIAQLAGTAVDATARISGAGQGDAAPSAANQPGFSGGAASKYRGARGLDPELIKEIEKLYGFDKPPLVRFIKMMRSYIVFDFGDSFFQDRTVADLVFEKLPVSISLGLWTMLLTHLISIPLGIAKAVRDGSRFDIASSFFVVVGNAVPNFLFAIFLIILFAGSSFWNIFPNRGLVSADWSDLGLIAKAGDYLWHMVLPISAMVIGGFATLTMLTKNSFLDQINMQYVITARSKGLSENRVLYGHVFRNAMLIVIAGFPATFIAILFTGSLLIEIIFSLDGLGLLGFEAIVNRDYPVVFGTLFVFTMIGLVLNLVGDIMYNFIDPRIDFEKRTA